LGGSVVENDREVSVTVLGSTGSIGRQALEVIRDSGGRLRVHSLAVRRNVDLLLGQISEFSPRRVAVSEDAAAARLREGLSALPPQRRPEVLAGEESLVELARDPGADVVLNAVVGATGLRPTLAALEAGRRLALANKESLVAAGDLVMEKVQRGGSLVPVDSEHSSIFRCLRGFRAGSVRSITVTASGGAFRDWPLERLKEATPEDALRHPVWRMGARVTVDSATMMNKALEIVEAKHLFGVPAERISVLLHPQACVHGIVELSDGTLLAHLAPPDMKVPIAYALHYPEEPPASSPPLDLALSKDLQFLRPDPARYPCLELGYDAARDGGTKPAAMNAADEVAVRAFLEGRIPFTEIARIVAKVMEGVETRPVDGLETVLRADAEARERAWALVRGFSGWKS